MVEETAYPIPIWTALQNHALLPWQAPYPVYEEEETVPVHRRKTQNFLPKNVGETKVPKDDPQETTKTNTQKITSKKEA